jgi:carbonic anhydrase
MSVFDNVNDWPDIYKSCGAPHQSPINLSRTFALPCDRLCEWKIDEVAIQEATIVNATPEFGGLQLINFSTGTPTAKFNGEGYTCQAIIMYSSSQHSIENIFGEAELVAYFTNPKGYVICMSVLVRSAPGDTPSSRFFNSFVPYTDNDRQRITLGNNWMLTDVLPETPSYYVYEGTTIWPNCTPDVTWIVYSNTVTMDPSDYAKLASRIPQKRRPLQEVADRQVFFNDGEGEVNPAYAKKDGKIYMRCRKILKDKDITEENTKRETRVSKSGLVGKVQEEQVAERSLRVRNAQSSVQEQYEKIGGMWGIILLVFISAISYYLFFSENGADVVKTAFRYMLFVPIVMRTFIINMLYS